MSADWSAFWQRFPFKSKHLLSWYEQNRFSTYKKLLEGIGFVDFADLGGGTGISAKNLSTTFNIPGIIVDNNEEAYKLYQEMGGGNTTYVRKDLFDYHTKHDLIISDGLIEHFHQPERSELIKKHKSLANKYVLIFVPKNIWYVNICLRFKHGYEKHYQRQELIREVEEADLKPVAIASDFHMYGVLCRA